MQKLHMQTGLMLEGFGKRNEICHWYPVLKWRELLNEGLITQGPLYYNYGFILGIPKM